MSIKNILKILVADTGEGNGKEWELLPYGLKNSIP
jgi:hypothetical protein